MENEMAELQRLSYNTEYTTDINMKMRIPDKISMSGDEGGDGLETDMYQQTGMTAASMQVPGKILVGGSGTHVGMSDSPRALNLDLMEPLLPGETPVGLTTPPRVLKLEDHEFPSVQDEPVGNPSQSYTSSSSSTLIGGRNGPRMDTSISMEPVPGTDDLQILSIGADEDEIIEEPVAVDIPMLRHQVARLSRRILVLEKENHTRASREFMLFAVAISYFTFKGVRFLYRHF
ncbi:mitochondrial fission factor-like isoform X2 [Glandiceps talaboti]